MYHTARPFGSSLGRLAQGADPGWIGSTRTFAGRDTLRRLWRCGMVGGLKHVLVQAGREREFEKLFAELRAEMHTSEPGCVYYSLLKSRTNPRAYIVEEQYRDQGSLEVHESSAHGKLYFAKIRAILESITVEYFDVTVA
jgi:quinol monooxygenase YgiN